MYSDAQIRAAGSNDDVTYIANKHRGGIAGQAGSRYEDLYAVFRLTKAAAAALSNGQGIAGEGTLTITSQARCFVDDVVLHGGTLLRDEYFQLRNTEAVSWGRKKRSLVWNFTKQVNLASKSGRSAVCLLVTRRRKTVRKLNRTRPSRLPTGCKAVHFPSFPRVEDYVQRHPPFADAVRTLLAKPVPSTADLVWLARCFFAAWTSGAGSVRLDAALVDLETMRGTYIRPSAGDGAVNPALLAQLATIQDLVVYLFRGYLSWEYNFGTERGTLTYSCHTPQFAEFERWVLQSRPTDFDALAGWLGA